MKTAKNDLNNENEKWSSIQLSKDRAIAFGKSGEWKKWNAEQIVRFQLFQKLFCVDPDAFGKALSRILKRPVFHHELKDIDSLKEEYLGSRSAPALKEIFEFFPKEKLLTIAQSPKRKP